MKLIDNRGIHDPTLNLALEEYSVRNLPTEESYVLFYVNEPSIIIGKNQNTLEEINHEYVRREGIHVVRRISGGGTVYHDHGNLNFSFIQRYKHGSVLNFKEFTDPIVRILRELGVPAEMTGRNDIVADGRKISGNAQFFTANRMFSHGTLLFDSELERVVEALNVKMSKIESKGLKSIRSRVANIREFLDDPSLDLESFLRRITEGLFAGQESIEVHEFDEAAWRDIHELASTKYRQWDWNFGSSPAFNVQKVHRFPVGELDARIQVEKGVIESIKIFGDFFGQHDVAELERRLVGVRFDRDALERALEECDPAHFFGGLTRDEFVDFLY